MFHFGGIRSQLLRMSNFQTSGILEFADPETVKCPLGDSSWWTVHVILQEGLGSSLRSSQLTSGAHSEGDKDRGGSPTTGKQKK